MMRIAPLYFRLLGMHLRSLMEYPADSWIMAAATLLTQVVNVVFLTAIFARVPVLQGWTFWAVLAMFGCVALAEGAGSLLFEGTWRIAESINQGTLDYLLVRPYPVVLQVMSLEVGINGLTNILTGASMVAVALTHANLHWSPAQVLITAILLVGAITVKVSISLATNSLSFWLSSPNPLFAIAVHQIGDLSRFPLAIYPAALKVILGVVVPFAFVSVFPVSYFMRTGHYAWLGLLTPIFAGYCLTVALKIFRHGLRRYEGSGN